MNTVFGPNIGPDLCGHVVPAREFFALTPTIGELRRQIKDKQKQLSPWALPLNLIPDAILSGIKSVGMFSFRQSWGEPNNFSQCFSWAKDRKLEFLLPRTTASGENAAMSFHSVGSLDELITDPKWGILEPKQSPAKIPELLLLPASVVDGTGNRLGRGGGFYDRFLLQFRTQVSIAIAVVHESFFVDSIPSQFLHTGDARVDGVLTSRSFSDFRRFL